MKINQGRDLVSESEEERVIVAMSGGVDSCAAALLLAEAGWQVIGISMQVWDYRKSCSGTSRASCCAPADFEDARAVADRCGFPFYVFDFEDSFDKEVIAPFVESYLHGRTPNPCLDCNRKVKFKLLRERGELLGASLVATGHYAQIKPLPDGKLGLFTGEDREKDQSYFLYALTQQDLCRTLFPVGGMRKTEVRAYLEEKGFRIAQKPESQDICFVSGAVGDFVRERVGAVGLGGKVIDVSGQVLGFHDGYFRYTVGQRRGLGVSAAHPLYVLEVRPDTREVVVGSKDELRHSGFLVASPTWVSDEAPKEPFYGVVKLRYRHQGVRCEIRPQRQVEAENGSSVDVVEVIFENDWTAITPGQAAVFYLDDSDGEGAARVLGGGTIMGPNEGSSQR